MFLLQDPFRERVLVVGVKNWDRLLNNDGAVVQFFIDEVNRAPRGFHSVREGLLLRFETRKCG